MLTFPPALAPPAPFPLVTNALRIDDEFVAPGVRRASYRLLTSSGPLLVHAVSVDPRAPFVRFGVVVANDALVSRGETVSSMARRTGAVAGINGDYFDIGQTNQPLNVVVRDGALVRTPSARYALDVTRAGEVRFDRFRFTGSVRYGNASVPLTTVNEFPPQGGATLLTPAFGAIAAAANVTLATLRPDDDAPGAYRVVAVGPANAHRIDGPTLGFGPAALALAPPPAPGDVVHVGEQLDPAPESLACALGGGPLLVSDGAPFDDADAPAPDERDRRFPVSGALVTTGGTVVLLAVDGRAQSESIGLTRPEFAALMLGFGARAGLAFDSGGSATLAARVLGDPTATVLNAPSDGEERPVADGLFVYSDAPAGKNLRLVVRPARTRALAGARIALRGAIVDDAGNAVRSVALPPYRVPVASGTQTARIVDAASGLAAPLEVDVVSRLATLALEASDPNPVAGERVTLLARGSDAHGDAVDVGDLVAYRAERGEFAAPGVFVPDARDTTVVARAGGVEARLALRVGRHTRALNLITPARAGAWRFASAPPNAPGNVSFDDGGATLRLAYDFATGARAAYAETAFPVPDVPLSFSLDVFGDGAGTTLRAAFLNRFGERDAVTLAAHVDWTGWRRVDVPLPHDLTPPVTLVALYVVPSAHVRPSPPASGALAFRSAAITVPGSP